MAMETQGFGCVMNKTQMECPGGPLAGRQLLLLAPLEQYATNLEAGSPLSGHRGSVEAQQPENQGAGREKSPMREA